MKTVSVTLRVRYRWWTRLSVAVCRIARGVWPWWSYVGGSRITGGAKSEANVLLCGLIVPWKHAGE